MVQTEDSHKEQMIEIKKMNEQELICKWYELLENLPFQSSEEYYKEQIETIKERLLNVNDKSFSKKSIIALATQINRYKDEFSLKNEKGLMLNLHKVGSYDYDSPYAAFIEIKNQLKKLTFGQSFKHQVIEVDYGSGNKPLSCFRYISKNKITENEDETFDQDTLAEYYLIDLEILAKFLENELKRLEEIVEVNYVVLVNFFEQLKKRIDKKFGLL